MLPGLRGSALSCPAAWVVAWPACLAQVTPAPGPSTPVCFSLGVGSPLELASRGRGNGGLQRAEDDSVRGMQRSKGLIKTLKLVPNEVSRRSALEESQARGSEQCLFSDRVVAMPWVPPPTPAPHLWRVNCSQNTRQSQAGVGAGPGHRPSLPQGHRGGGFPAQHLRCPQGTWSGQVCHLILAGTGGWQRAASLP